MSRRNRRLMRCKNGKGNDDDEDLPYNSSDGNGDDARHSELCGNGHDGWQRSRWRTFKQQRPSPRQSAEQLQPGRSGSREGSCEEDETFARNHQRKRKREYVWTLTVSGDLIQNPGQGARDFVWADLRRCGALNPECHHCGFCNAALGKSNSYRNILWFLLQCTIRNPN
jgi:hypothetical protein